MPSQPNRIMTTPIYRAMNRPSLFWGGDREMMLFMLLIVFTLIFVSFKIVVIAIALAFAFGMVSVLRWMAKADPEMRKVYLRHRLYSAHYHAAANPFAPTKLYKD